MHHFEVVVLSMANNLLNVTYALMYLEGAKNIVASSPVVSLAEVQQFVLVVLSSMNA
jgi:hypothetical protein